MVGIKVQLRLSLFYILSGILLLLALAPEALFIYQLVTNPSLWAFIFAPVVLTVLYMGSCVIFAVLHSIVVKIVLPGLKEGFFLHASDEGKLMAIRIIADGLLKSMLQNLWWIPILNSRILLPYLLRLYGLKCGKGVHIASRTWIDTALVELGDNSFMGVGSIVSSHVNEEGGIYVKTVRIGKNVTIGAGSLVSPGCTIGDGVVIGAVSGVLKDQTLPPNTIWAGLPVKLIRKKNDSDQS